MARKQAASFPHGADSLMAEADRQPTRQGQFSRNRAENGKVQSSVSSQTVGGAGGREEEFREEMPP